MLEIDVKQTKENAEKLLKDYVVMHRLEQRSILSADSNDGSIKGSPEGNPTENSMIQYIGAKSKCSKIREAIDNIGNERYRIILHDKYLIDGISDTEIYTNMHFGKTTFYNILKKALIAFAQTCYLVQVVYLKHELSVN
ncbi:ArpU family phage packaging/lysis transcriptional regulator [Apilactobacillus xinyiensis]|uniref:ArpU family phage packaging/lysis transcriptional regulator n=1 Tax=Apilactobacillus xinyiensis TaxID=2841032 RepID=UPI00200F2F88|nr:ArpU family phage packaging/lysis transcriptional regulator [Apilactobacillus xinyiensis]MCL0330647.1 hypothetical protein [Apilactobacillus xinyiensis]